jgi:hypothetical protein
VALGLAVAVHPEVALRLRGPPMEAMATAMALAM